MGGASRNEIVRTVQTDIEHGVSVYDEQFAQQRERFGEAFVHEYLSEVATHMAVHIVRAFEEHDRKRYQRCARSFGAVYTFLFPVHPREAYSAGSSYALALKHHDVIEDGIGDRRGRVVGAIPSTSMSAATTLIFHKNSSTRRTRTVYQGCGSGACVRQGVA